MVDGRGSADVMSDYELVPFTMQAYPIAVQSGSISSLLAICIVIPPSQCLIEIKARLGPRYIHTILAFE